MHRLWNSIVEPLLLAASPKVIVEIGCAEGRNTIHLLGCCKERGAVLHAIDPKPRFDAHAWQSGYGDRFLFHRGKSLDTLPSLPSFDAILLDGDHNWYTVFHELLCVETMANKSGRFPLVLLHDVEWPYARRDAYANPEDIPPEFRQSCVRKGILRNGELSDEGALNPGQFHARAEGGPRNGVRTAIEDFLAQASFKLAFASIPGCHGLGILGTEEVLSGAPFKTILEPWTPAVIRHCRQLEEERLKEQEWLRGQRFLYERTCDRLAAASNDAKYLRVALETLKKKTENMENTISWRWTAPLRMLGAIRARLGLKTSKVESARPVIENSAPSAEPSSLNLPERLVTIIPTSGRDLTMLDRCIQSVCAAAGHLNHRIVIVLSPRDGMSVETLRKTYGQLIDICAPEGNFSFAKSVNAGLRHSQHATCILLLNDDCTLPKRGSLVSLIATLRLRHWACIGPWVHNARPDADRDLGPPRTGGVLELKSPVPGMCMLFDAAWTGRIGLFDENFGKGYGSEEADYLLRARTMGARWGRDDRITVLHENHATFGCDAAAVVSAAHQRNLRYWKEKHPGIDSWGQSKHWEVSGEPVGQERSCPTRGGSKMCTH